MKSILTLTDITKNDVSNIVECAEKIKADTSSYSEALRGRVLLMIFEKPSLRTRVSFDVAMHSLGGHSLTIDATSMPLGGKETIEDTAKASSRYVDIIMARMFGHNKLVKLSENASVPVINGLTDDFHPVQILSDLLTIKEKKGKFKSLKLCYLGDGKNNVTHSLLLGCAHAGIDIFVGCPKDMVPNQDVVKKAMEISVSSKVAVTDNTLNAVMDADIIYTDSWMSYHVAESEKEARIKKLMPYQVNGAIAAHAKKDYIFMNCLPAMRGYEQTAEIIDGKNSVVFDQAENRLHMQKSILLWCLK